MEKYVIIGFPKCGQMSLIKYLQKQGDEVIRKDWIWRRTALEELKPFFEDGYVPVVITRDPVERIWSGFNYWHYRTRGVTLPLYLKLIGYTKEVGEENPIA